MSAMCKTIILFILSVVLIANYIIKDVESRITAFGNIGNGPYHARRTFYRPPESERPRTFPIPEMPPFPKPFQAPKTTHSALEKPPAKPYETVRADSLPQSITNLPELIQRWKMNPNKAPEEIDSVIAEIDKSNRIRPLLELYEQKTFALMRVNRNIEALIEAKKCEKVCGKIPGCDKEAISIKLIKQIEIEMGKIGPHAVLGVAPDAKLAEIKKAYRRLMLMLHPDKNINLEQESQEHLKHLLLMVSEAYSALIAKQN